MNEPDVTLTDFAIAIECAIFCALALRWPARDTGLRTWWVLLFGSIGAGAVLGGIVHGWVYEPGTANAILWRATLLSLGVTAAAMWIIGARMQFGEPAVTWIRRAAIAQLIAYTAMVVFVYSRFLIAIATYLPAAVFLTVVMAAAYRRSRHRALAYGLAGLGLTFVAAAVQQLQLAPHPAYFNHNALYHLIQGIALFLLFLAARHTVTAPAATGAI